MQEKPFSGTALTSRVVRVFISSTFRDMQVEREELVKQVFPELRRRCRERQVELVEVDLRWGVTEEQANRGQVLPICLVEIERCRPYFIGLLGERYGWVPDAIPQELIDQEPWLKEHLHHSVTELEILHGVLNNPDMAQRSYFYFRDRAYLDTLPPEQRGDFLSEAPDAQAKLARLKDRIRQSGLPLKEDYPDPRTVGQWILTDLWEAIDQAFPAEEVPDPLAREAAEHEAFALSRAKVYIGRPEYFERLDSYVAGEDKPLVLLGESGVGKSALLANWVRRHRERHPEDLVFLHFLGSTPQSADYVALLHRLISELKARTGDPEDVPVQPDKLREALPLWLAKASAWAGREGRRVILVLDALNQLEDKDNAPDLGWLAEYFPPQVRVVLSTLPERPLTALEKRGWPTFTVAPLDPEEMRRAIPEYLGIYRKTLDAPLVEAIVAAPQAANPLYLKALLEELRVFGIFEELKNRVRHYLAAPDPPALYNLILERLEGDYERDRPGLAGEALSLIWAARRGLTESELLEIMGTEDGPLPRAFWSPLFLALEESLVSRSGLMNFFHDYLRQAVQERYLLAPEAQQAAHLRLAAYFEKRKVDERKADELPWQLHQAQAWEGLRSCLTDLDLFAFLIPEARRYELLGYWLALKKQGHDPVAAYQEALQRYQAQAPGEADLAARIHQVALFFDIRAAYPEALALYQQALALREGVVGPDHPDVALSLNNLAALYHAQGRFLEAEPLHLRSLNIREKVFGPDHPDVAQSLNNLAALYHAQGRFLEAEPLYQRSLAIMEKVLGPEHRNVASSLNNLAEFYRAQGRFPEAEPLYNRSLAIAEKMLGPEHPDVAQSLNNLGVLYGAQGRFPEAEPLHLRSLRIREKVLGPDHPEVAQSLNNLGALYAAQGRFPEAEPLHLRSLHIREKVFGPDNPDVASSLSALAGLYEAQGRFPEAEPLHLRSLHIREKVFGPDNPDVAVSL
ncbi:MAG: tetratricopeptide repeat protein, partial [Deltaproteobacteria bacterium]|nr:tetratricopeptide repeat protein [Deltaproteobacteria bacterium]